MVTPYSCAVFRRQDTISKEAVLSRPDVGSSKISLEKEIRTEENDFG